MTDEELLQGFEDASLPLATFHHEEHVRIAFLYLQRYATVEVLARFPVALQRYASAHGKDGLYHETISWAFIFIIAERIARGPAYCAWEEFRAANVDLFDRRQPILKRYYRAETLASDAARQMFVFPDRFCD
jgi:hypothetical protein